MAARDFPPRPQGAELDSVPMQNWLDALGNRQNIDLQQELTSVASGDEVMIFDVSETGQVKTKKVTLANILGGGLPGSFSTLTATGLLDISGASAGQIKFPATQNASSNANTLDDYEEGTWTPTWGGFSSAPTGGNARYVKIGKLVKCTVSGWAAGTSNATTKTITLPFASADADVMAGMGHSFDNGAFSNNPGRIDTRSASATCDLYRTLNADSWTAANGALMDVTLVYTASA